ncbi:glycosyltransferase family 39 protein, partial [bacterium]|nr:glycosyltransferase family 39 protein [bacterium]
MLCIFLFSLIVRFIYLYFFKQSILHIEHSLFGDAAQYILIAKNIASGSGFNMLPDSNLLASRAPLFPFILAGIFKLFGTSYWPARIFQVCISSLIPVITYLIGKEIASKRVATMSVSISVFYPFYVFYSAYVLTEILFVFLSCLSLLYLIRFIKTGSYRSSCLAGVFLGLSALTRPIALGFGVFFVMCYFFVPKRRLKGVVIILITM